MRRPLIHPHTIPGRRASERARGYWGRRWRIMGCSGPLPCVMTEREDDFDERPPSKSSRKRAALALQKLGDQLVRMRPDEVAQLPLDESLRDAIDEARRLTRHGAMARQSQYIGKLMREADVDAIEAALATQSEAQNTRARLKK